MHMRSVQSGFSLIELLVSMTIFTIVVTMSTGTLLILIDANSKAQNMQSVMSNVTFAIDSMAREIRTGSNYVCRSNQADIDDRDDTLDCGDGYPYLSIVEAGDSLTGGEVSQRVSYYFDPDYNGVDDGAILRRIGDDDDLWLPITATNVNIKDMEFSVTGSDRGAADGEQPMVTIFVEGEAGQLEGLDTSFVLQATIVQRTLDI